MHPLYHPKDAQLCSFNVRRPEHMGPRKCRMVCAQAGNSQNINVVLVVELHSSFCWKRASKMRLFKMISMKRKPFFGPETQEESASESGLKSPKAQKTPSSSNTSIFQLAKPASFPRTKHTPADDVKSPTITATKSPATQKKSASAGNVETGGQFFKTSGHKKNIFRTKTKGSK